ncbi:PssD/Cps14F family polysaccharide biosynthesis glycosyltransferase [Arthrobacter sp. YAF16]|uniref:PssD/Cps14F family polysaccharide biosynthesis glycosyltransferase n=1 Tax=Arthrobacter sp. YAF16 TaxID=3233076 RepID=UPI003F8EE007
MRSGKVFQEGPRAATPGTERILLVGSSGGHLAQLMSLRPWWSAHERAWVTFPTEDAKSNLEAETDVSWAFSPTTRNIPNLLRNAWLAYLVIRRFLPTVVVSTGAGSAFPFFVAARALGIATVYIEVFDRVESPTLTGRLCRPFSDLMLVQWRDQLGLYPDAQLLGRLL